MRRVKGARYDLVSGNTVACQTLPGQTLLELCVGAGRYESMVCGAEWLGMLDSVRAPWEMGTDAVCEGRARCAAWMDAVIKTAEAS